MLVQYLYVLNNPLIYVDPLGLQLTAAGLIAMVNKYSQGIGSFFGNLLANPTDTVLSATLDIVSANLGTQNYVLHNIAQALTGVYLKFNHPNSGLFFEHYVTCSSGYGYVDVVLQVPNKTKTAVMNYLFEIKPKNQHQAGFTQLRKYYNYFACSQQSYETNYDSILPPNNYFIRNLPIWSDGRHTAFMSLFHYGDGVITYEVDVLRKKPNDGRDTLNISSTGFSNMITQSQLKQQQQKYVENLLKSVDDLTAAIYGKPISKMSTGELVAAGIITTGAAVAVISFAALAAEAAAVFFTADAATSFAIGTTASGVVIKLQPVFEQAVEWIGKAA